MPPILSGLPDPHVQPMPYLLAGALVLLLFARRLRPIGWIVSLATWALLGVLLVTALGQRERFDPTLQKLAAALGLDSQRVSGRETRIRLSPNGHFWADARIDGVRSRMLVDSGATITALSERTAAAAGVRVRDELLPVLLRTANGTVRARTATVRELRLGDVVARDLAVVVSPAFGDTDVLGMNFLSRLQAWRVEGDTLILTPHHPQRD